MHAPKPSITDDKLAARRKAARRTAWIAGALAIAVYVAFLLSGVFGQ